MTQAEALATALEKVDRLTQGPDGPVIQAARERLAQLPEKCGTCGGTGKVKRWKIDSGLPPGGVSGYQGREWPETCPTCHGRGVLYPPALVERIAKALYGWPAAFYDDLDPDRVQWYFEQAVAVLDALNMGNGE